MNPLFGLDSAKFFATKFRGLTGKYQRYWINGSLQPTKTPEELQLLVDLTTNGGSDCESQVLRDPPSSSLGSPILSNTLKHRLGGGQFFTLFLFKVAARSSNMSRTSRVELLALLQALG